MDGGIFAHNPTMAAVSSVTSPDHLHQQRHSQLEVLSLGTGRMAQYIEGDDLDWGIMQWARKVRTFVCYSVKIFVYIPSLIVARYGIWRSCMVQCPFVSITAGQELS